MADRYDIEEARLAKAHRTRALTNLGKGKLRLAEVLREPPEDLKKTDVWVILLACQGLGPEGARRICVDAHIWPHTQLEKLTKRERADMIRALPKRVQ